MKLTRKLIPAFVMLLVSAVLMSTASFAWFAMNNTVQANGMEVAAKAGDIFLEIKGPADSDWGTIGASNVDAELYPVDHDAFDSASDIETPGKWFYYYVKNLDHATNEKGNKTPLTVSTNNYVVKTTYQVRLNADMMTTAYDLYISSISLPDNTGISAIIKCGDEYKEFKESATITWASDDDNIADVMSDTPLDIDVYLYIHGENSNVKTDNVENLFGQVSFTLDASATQRTAGTP